MKLLTVLFVLGSVCAASGQGKFAVSVQVAPIFRHSDSKTVLPIPDPATQLPTTELISRSNSTGLSGGINIRYAFTPAWSISTGLWAGHTIHGQSEYTQNGIYSSIPLPVKGLPFTVGYSTPLLLNFQPSRKRLSPYFSLGALAGYQSKTYIPVNTDEYIIVKLGKAVTVTPLVGAGIIYRTGKHTSLIVQPAFQYNISNHRSYDYYHSYSVSVLTQFMYHF